MSWVEGAYAYKADIPKATIEAELYRELSSEYNREATHLPFKWLDRQPFEDITQAKKFLSEQEHWRRYNIAVPYYRQFISSDDYSYMQEYIHKIAITLSRWESGVPLKKCPDKRVRCMCGAYIKASELYCNLCPKCKRRAVELFYPEEAIKQLTQYSNELRRLRELYCTSEGVGVSKTGEAYNELYWYIEAFAYIG